MSGFKTAMLFRLSFVPFFIIFWSLISCCTASSQDLAHARKGIIDLRNESFTDKVALDGEWEFYWKELLGPQSKAPGKPEFVNFPFRWDGEIWHGEKLPSFGYATYKLRIYISPQERQLILGLPDTYSSSRLFINGKLAESNGKVSTSEQDFMPHWEYKTVLLPADQDTVDLILQIANFAHSKGGIKKSIYIGDRQVMKLSRARDEAIDLLLTGCLFMGGFFFLGLYLLGNRDNAILYFALFSLVYSYRIAGIDNYVLHTVMPDIPWFLTVHLEYISLFLGICFFAR
jgi:two-component system, sensor histidine kinase